MAKFSLRGNGYGWTLRRQGDGDARETTYRAIALKLKVSIAFYTIYSQKFIQEKGRLSIDTSEMVAMKLLDLTPLWIPS